MGVFFFLYTLRGKWENGKQRESTCHSIPRYLHQQSYVGWTWELGTQCKTPICVVGICLVESLLLLSRLFISRIWTTKLEQVINQVAAPIQGTATEALSSTVSLLRSLMYRFQNESYFVLKLYEITFSESTSKMHYICLWNISFKFSSS